MYKSHLVFNYAISLQTIHYFYQIDPAEIFILHTFTKSLQKVRTPPLSRDFGPEDLQKSLLTAAVL